MKNNPIKKYKGSAILDSLMALALLGSILTSWVMFNQVNYNRKIARKIAAETTEYARVYAKYMNDKYSDLLAQTQNGSPAVLTPSSIGGYWNSDLASQNLFKQTPCVTVVPNKKTGDLEAVMYYVGGQRTVANKYAMIMRQALIILGSKGGLLLNGMIQGNSGWHVDSGSTFLSNSNQCNSGELSNDSIAVNIDLMDQWNQDTQPYYAISKEQDNGTDIRKKPGHMLNYNTSKSDITVRSGNGVILDNSDQNNPIKLKMGYGNGTNAATVGLYTNGQAISKTLVDTIEPVQAGIPGDSCDYQEIGKIIADNGNTFTTNILNRSTLICSQNHMMCGAINSTATCYLPTESNRVVFSNATQGIQNDNGSFMCPRETPFALNVKTSGGVSNAILIQGSLSGYTVTLGYSIRTPGTIIIKATCSNMPDFTINAIPG